MRGRGARLVGLLLLLPAAARAGGYLAFDTTGVPVGWSTAGPVAYHTDQGGLGTLSQAEAVALVAELFGVWQAVPTAAIQYARAGTLPVDVDETNFGDWLGPFGGATAPTGMSAIVFDEDGEIFETLFGVNTGVLGFAGPSFYSDGTTTVASGPIPSGSRIVEGLAFLNGEWIDGVDDPANGNFELPSGFFEAVFVHEFGHFSGLDHTQIHGLFNPPPQDVGGTVETMYSFLVSSSQSTPERDDVVTLSRLYPVPGLLAATGCLAGSVLTREGLPLTGVNVVARNLDDPADAVSWVSGAGGSTGAWSICGLEPGVSYRVDVRELDVAARGGSSVGPLQVQIPMPGPPEAWSGAFESADPAVDDPAGHTAAVPVAGGTVGGIHVRLNRQSHAVENLLRQGSNSHYDAALGDFDRDGILDLAGVQQGFVPGNVVTVSRGLGNGTFAAPVVIDSFPGNFAIVTGQLNAGQDAFLDLAAASFATSEVRIYFGDGDGGFAAPATVLDTPHAPIFQDAQLAAGRFNGDAFLDLAFLVREADESVTVHAILGSAVGVFSLVTTTIPPASGVRLWAFRSLTVGHFAGGPGDDIVISNTDGAAILTNVALLTGDGAGRFTASLVPLDGVSQRIGQGIVSGDFDGDGHRDLAVNDLDPIGGPPGLLSSIDLLLGDGLGGFTFSARYLAGDVFQAAITTGDFDRDGRLDVASTGAWAAAGSPGANVMLAYGDGAGGIARVERIWGLAEFPGLSPGALDAADLDGDGWLDLLVSDTATGVAGIDTAATLSVLRRLAPAPLSFYTVIPCRVLDTRQGAPLASGVSEVVEVAGACGIPPTARAVSANVTVTQSTAGGHVTLWPAGPTPTTSTINFGADQTRANNAVLSLAGGDGGAVPGTLQAVAAVAGGGQVDLILDVNGYFE